MTSLITQGQQQLKLGLWSIALATFERAIALDETDVDAWEGKTAALKKLGRWGEAIEVEERLVEVRSRGIVFDAYFYYKQGYQFYELGRYEQAIESYEKAIEIEPNFHQAWHGHAVSLHELGREEEAIASYEKAIEIESDYYAVWSDRGTSLNGLGRYEKAIESFDKAIEIKLDDHEAWYSRGISLHELGRNEEAIASYEKAIEIKLDNHEAWSNRGASLSALGQNEEAVASYEKAIEIKPDDHEAWYNRSLATVNSRSQSSYPFRTVLNQRTAQLHLKHPELTQRGYNGELASLTIGLLYCPSDTYPLGHGFLQRCLGDAHRYHANLQSSRLHPDWSKAIIAYKASLRCLTAIEHPAERLLTLQALIRTHLALNEIPQARHYQTEAIPLYSQLRDTARDKRQFELQHLSISRTEIDLLLGENNPTRALEQAEFYKNRALTWILDDWESQSLSPTYAGMRSLLTPDTAIVYWHLSDDALTTFILTYDSEIPIVLECDRYNAANKLNELLKDYKREYRSYQELKKDKTEIEPQDHPWRKHLSKWIDTIKEILDIGAIESHLQNQKSNIQNLILTSHRDLNLLPLNIFFPHQSHTSLPSIRIGIESRAQTRPIAPKPLLLIEATAYTQVKIEPTSIQ
jgi:tetratricopeptide (TPR) repeat protein